MQFYSNMNACINVRKLFYTFAAFFFHLFGVSFAFVWVCEFWKKNKQTNKTTTTTTKNNQQQQQKTTNNIKQIFGSAPKNWVSQWSTTKQLFYWPYKSELHWEVVWHGSMCFWILKNYRTGKHNHHAGSMWKMGSTALGNLLTRTL